MIIFGIARKGPVQTQPVCSQVCRGEIQVLSLYSKSKDDCLRPVHRGSKIRVT